MLSFNFNRLSHFDISNLNSLSGTFKGCSSITSFNLSYFKSDKMIDLSSLFSNCTNLKSFDISNLNTSNVVNMKYNICLVHVIL